MMGLVPRTNVDSQGTIVISGRDLSDLNRKELRQVRGAEVAMVFQDPMTSLNPVVKIGKQFTELYASTSDVDEGGRRIGIELLRSVTIPDPKRARAVPAPAVRRHATTSLDRHRTRMRPPLLFADEPTTALDVTVQAQILAPARRAAARALHGDDLGHP